MILSKIENLFDPILKITENLNYKNIKARDKYNCILSSKKLIHEFDDDIDNGILHSINYYDNLNCFIIFGKNKNDAYKLYQEHFKNNYLLYGIKYIYLNFHLIPKIMYQLLFSRIIIENKHDLYNALESEYKYLSSYSKEKIDITILIVCKKNLNNKYPINDIHEKDYFIYIPNTKDSIMNCASVFFCNSTIKFLEIQNFDYFLTKENENSKNMFMKYRSWIYENIDILYRNQFMLFSSIVLYLIGHRAMNDLDLYIHTIPSNIFEKLNDFKKEEYSYIEFKVKNTEFWPLHWNTWLDIWADKCGAKYFEEIIANPKYHFYFLGIKVISLECDIVRRIERNRPRATADLIALRKRYSYKINIPNIPEYSFKYISTLDKSKDDIIKLIAEGGILNEDNKEICIRKKVDKIKFIDTIIWTLQTRYRMIFTVEDIKREWMYC